MLKQKNDTTRKKWTRNCPECGKLLEYSNKSHLTNAIKQNSRCNSCAKSKEHHPLYNKKRPEHSKKMIGKNNPMFGKTAYDIWKEKYGKEVAVNMWKEHYQNMSGSNHPHYGIARDGKISKKIRLSILKMFEERYGQMAPNYNPNSIPIIEAKAKELGISDLQHAENGGEFYIKELGYWVDGYSPSKNIVIEYYEPFHKKQVERDKRRKQEIINYLNCEFIEIKSI